MTLATLFGVCVAIIGSRAEFGHSGKFASRFENGLDLTSDKEVVADVANDALDALNDIVGCCVGTDSACDTTSEPTCDKNAKRKGCEWRAGTTSNPPDCSDPTPEPGCCAGPSDACYDAFDDAACTKLARRSGCEWRAGKDADCTPTTARRRRRSQAAAREAPPARSPGWTRATARSWRAERAASGGRARTQTVRRRRRRRAAATERAPSAPWTTRSVASRWPTARAANGEPAQMRTVRRRRQSRAAALGRPRARP